MMNLSTLKAQPLVGLFDYRLHALQRLPILAILIGLAYLIAYQSIELVLVVLVASAGLLILLLHPWLVWPLIALILPVASAITIGPAKLTDFLLMGAVALWFIDGVRRRNLQLAFGVPTLLFLLYASFQASLLLVAEDLGEAITEVIKWVEILALLALIPAMVPAEKRTWIVVALLVGGAMQALLGVYQFIFQIGHPSFVLMDRFMRASGTFRQPNPFAGYLGTLLPIGVSMSLFALSDVSKVGLPKAGFSKAGFLKSERFSNRALLELLFYGSTSAIIGLGMIVSWSRGGWLGTFAGVGFVLAYRNRRTLLVSGLIGLFLASMLLLTSFELPLIPASFQTRIGNLSGYLGVNIDGILNQPVDDDNFSIVERLAHWKAAILMWQQAPWTGVGPGGYATAYPQTIQADPRLLLWEDPLGHAHNIYLNLLAETGLSGLIAYLGLMAGLLVWLLQQIQKGALLPSAGSPVAGSLAIGPLAVGIVGMFAYLTVHNGFDNVYVQGIYLHLGFWLALLVE